MKRLFLTLVLLCLATPAWAQNPQCPTRGASDSSNACASTAFVKSVVVPDSIISCGAVGNGTTDNTAVIQTCFNTHTAILIPAGTFCSRGLTIPTTLKLIEIQGELKACGSIAAFGGFILANSPSGLTITGFGTINVNETTYASNGVIAILSGTNVTISGININQGGRFPIQIITCTNCTVSGVIAQNYTQSAVNATDCGACSFLDNRFVAPFGASGTVTINVNIDGGNDLIVSRNYIYGGGIWGIHTHNVERGEISGNNIQDTEKEAITISGNYIQIINNNLVWGGTIGSDFGISQQGDDVLHVASFNTYSGNTITNSYSSGIAIAAQSIYTTIDNNTLINVGRSGNALHAAGIDIDGINTTYTFAQSNTVIKTASGNTVNCVRELSNGDYTFVKNNICKGMTSTDIVLAGTNSKIISQYDITAGVPTPYTATIACTGGGALANVSQTMGYQFTNPPMVGLSLKLTADLNTCAGNLQISLPFTANATYGAGSLIGGNLTTGAAIFAAFDSGATALTTLGIVSGINPITGAGQTIEMTGTYFK